MDFEWDPEKAVMNEIKQPLVQLVVKRENNMKDKIDPENPPFDFSRARRLTPDERAMFRKAIEKKLGVTLPSRGRPLKKAHERSKAISIRLHPNALAWAKQEAKRRGVGYQTVINDVLLKHAA